MFFSPFNTLLLVIIGVLRGSAFRYPCSAKCLVTVERETSIPMFLNLSAISSAEIIGFLRTYWPIAREVSAVIFLWQPFPPLCFISPVLSSFLRLRYIVLSGIFVSEWISEALRVSCFQNCNIIWRWSSCLDGAISKQNKAHNTLT